MKKVSCIAIIAMVMACPAFADIAANNNNPTCDSATIGATSGDTALDATWTANTLNLKFMANGQQFASNTCTYGQNITIPTGTPTRTGYNFAGWQLSTNAGGNNNPNTGNNNNSDFPYTECYEITNETTCNSYANEGCYWYDEYDECLLDPNHVPKLSQSRCVDEGLMWCDNICADDNPWECSNIDQNDCEKWNGTWCEASNKCVEDSGDCE